MFKALQAQNVHFFSRQNRKKTPNQNNIFKSKLLCFVQKTKHRKNTAFNEQNDFSDLLFSQ
jgi:hypothetical protein